MNSDGDAQSRDDARASGDAARRTWLRDVGGRATGLRVPRTATTRATHLLHKP